MKKRIFINITLPVCKYLESHITEYHDGYVEEDNLCTIDPNNKAHCLDYDTNCDKAVAKDNCGMTKEELLNLIETTLKQYATDNEVYTDHDLAEAVLNKILEKANV